MDKIKIQGWKNYICLPGTEGTQHDLMYYYLKIAQKINNKSSFKLNELLSFEATGCRQSETLPSIGKNSWALSAIFRAAPGQKGKVKIYFPLINNSTQKLENDILIFTQGNVVEPDVDKILQKIISVFKTKIDQ